MTLTERVAAHLPFLRRYSRAITGSQTSGDAFVVATLEALIADLSIFPEASSDRVAIYKLFVRILKSAQVDVPHAVSPFAWEKKAVANLSAVPTQARHAFLLVSVEGFSFSEAAEILTVSIEDVKRLIDEATQEISRQISTEIMIIEDEPLIALDIEHIVLDLGHSVSGIARTHAEALDLYRRSNPGMILADIHLADGSSGIDAINDILKVASVPVIFITAFPERLLTGERAEPTFLVTKPYNPDMLKALISQALFFNDGDKAYQALSA
ncbi:DNA-directed RNA polymerase specialized sigma24 family protein [Rhizobium sp. SG_E_25_P2]|jgi:DNA-directed RNA polymerase specialized sigma24 family protein|uniref:response regulator n=1 Tax=Rhizobium sp. SG_E_25_P2 TaxID=2879942 RepID=UPI002473772F|nr:response regulator [Rhizobium sp. SG_E_25_P2]MDH6266415.1 DNA-directed RNA polymerase specialized sigma24 family protein [Rhizobium sp. SG_E_25_P2]